MKNWIILIIALLLLTGRASAAEATLPKELTEAAPEVSDLIDSGSEGFGLVGGIAALWTRSMEKMETWLLSGARNVASIMAGVAFQKPMP